MVYFDANVSQTIKSGPLDEIGLFANVTTHSSAVRG